MSIKYTTLAKFVDINPESITRSYKHDQIEYIDISSVGSGILVNESAIVNLKEAPSRAKRIVRDGDTILATVRPNLRSFLFVKNPKNNTIVSTGFAVLRAKKNYHPRFIYYAVTEKYFTDYLTNNSKGTSYPAVDTETILRGIVPDFSVEKQNKIASILSAYDNLIENNNRRIQLLEQAARHLYREWFVAYRFPGHEHVKITNGIPEGWEIKKLYKIANITMGQSPKSDYYNEEGIGLPFHQGVSNFTNRFPVHKTYCSVLQRIAEPDDILFSVRAPVGRINRTTDKIVIGRGLSAIRSKDKNQSFLFYALSEKFFRDDLIGIGSIYAAITKNDLYEVAVLHPPKRLIDTFSEYSEPIDYQIEILHKANQKLTQARDLLLPRLMNGDFIV